MMQPLLLCLMLVALPIGPEPPTAAEETSEPASLWHAAPPLPTPDSPPAQRKPWVLREREITLDVPLLQILKNASARPHPRVTVE
ncbi:MAG TPA: hypothetical protein VLA47_03225, partial [Nitrospira sp.]|nr:hypothetical protein [Nitrospira sp.]